MIERKKRSIIIFSLCGLLLLMVFGYATFNTILNIDGTTIITSNWDVLITNIESKNIVGSAYDIEDPTHTNLEATFKTGLISPGDSITYDITVENHGTFNAYLQKITINKKDNPAILFETSGLQENDKLEPQESKVLTITVTYNPDVTTDPGNKSADFTVVLDFDQTVPVIDATPNVSYKCPDGYSQSGSGSSMTCSKTLTQTPSCNALGNNATGCVMTVNQYPYYSNSCTAIINFSNCSYTCPNSGNVSFNFSTGLYCPQKSYYCSYSGQRLTYSLENCTTQTSYTCSSGYSLSGSTCRKTEYATRLEIITYTCPDGYTLKETNKCYKD